MADDTDVITRTLGDLEMSAVFYAASELTAPWGIAMPALPGTMVFHVVTQGGGTVVIGGTTTRLEAGQVVLVPHGTGHDILDAPDSTAVPLFDLPRTEVGDRYEHIRAGGGGELTRLVCGAVGFSGLGMPWLVAALPPVLRLGHGDGGVRAALEMIGRESRRTRVGSDVVTARLADVLVVHALRAWVDQARPALGWVAALRDPRLGEALAAFHADPARPWTLTELARVASMSRSGYAARFAAVVGEPAMTYVTRWRMDLAARLVAERELPLAAVAVRVGYRSESAFNRAFRRAHGRTPGAFARRGPELSPSRSRVG